MSFTDPLVWLIILGGTLLIFIAWELWLLGRHLRKVDDLANALHADLTVIEADVAVLKAERASKLPGRRLPTMEMPAVQTDGDAHFYGRHAHLG